MKAQADFENLTPDSIINAVESATGRATAYLELAEFYRDEDNLARAVLQGRFNTSLAGNRIDRVTNLRIRHTSREVNIDCRAGGPIDRQRLVLAEVIGIVEDGVTRCTTTRVDLSLLARLRRCGDVERVVPSGVSAAALRSVTNVLELVALKPAEPSRIFLVPNCVFAAIRSIVSRALAISA